MSQSYIQAPLDGTGKKIATSIVKNLNGDSVHVEWNSDPPVSPQRLFFSATLGANASESFDGYAIASGKTGKLSAALLSAAMPCQFTIQESGGGQTFGGVQIQALPFLFTPPHRDYCKITGDGAKTFTITAQDLSGQANPVMITLFYDVVEEV